MTRDAVLLALAAATLLADCRRGAADGEPRDDPAQAVVPGPRDDPFYTDATMNADEVIRRNDLAINEGIRMDRVLVAHDTQDHARFERLKLACTGNLHPRSAEVERAIARCIAKAW